jgi:hypothetical protein
MRQLADALVNDAEFVVRQIEEAEGRHHPEASKLAGTSIRGHRRAERRRYEEEGSGEKRANPAFSEVLRRAAIHHTRDDHGGNRKTRHRPA